jgi:hypothetical protein
MEILTRELGEEITHIVQEGKNAYILTGKTKQGEI